MPVPVTSAFAVGVGLGVGEETGTFATTLQLPASRPVKRPVEVTVPHELAAESATPLVPVTSAFAVAVVPAVGVGLGVIIAEVVQVIGRPAISSPFWSYTCVENWTVPPTVVAADAGTTEMVVGTLAMDWTFRSAVQEKPVDAVPVVTSAATRTPVPVRSAPRGAFAPAVCTAEVLERAVRVPVPATEPELNAYMPLAIVRTEPIVEVRYIAGQATPVAPPEAMQETVKGVSVWAGATIVLGEIVQPVAVGAGGGVTEIVTLAEQVTLLVVATGAAAPPALVDSGVVETISALAVIAALPAALPAVNVLPLIVPSVAEYESDWQETSVPPSKHFVESETDWPASTEDEEGVTLQEYPTAAAEAMPIRARTTNTENIDKPFFIYTTLAYFVFYLFIILVPCERRLERRAQLTHARTK